LCPVEDGAVAYIIASFSPKYRGKGSFCLITFNDKDCYGLATAVPRFHNLNLIFWQEVGGRYRSTRCSTTGMLDGERLFGFLDGSDPSGGGPTAGRGPAGSSARCDVKPDPTVRCSSIWSPSNVPEYVLFPALK